MESTDVVIIGAGPYGLSLASHLRSRGVDHVVIGTPMSAWRAMSPGMYLKSFTWATSLPMAEKAATLPEYCRQNSIDPNEPVEIAAFADYGEALQSRFVPSLLATNVSSLRKEPGGFNLTLDGGARLAAKRVVVATGLSGFEHVPESLSRLPSELIAHTAHVGDFSPYRGEKIAVIGRGQSALQAATLLHEHGAQPILLARADIDWHSRMPLHRSLRENIMKPQSTTGPGRRGWTLDHLPMLMHYVPDSVRLEFTRSHLGPCGAWWLRDRFENNIEVRTGVSISDASISGQNIVLKIGTPSRNLEELKVDRVIAGTGYIIDVDGLRFIEPNLRSAISRIERAPRLSRHFESSVSGLYFVGPSSAASFGTLFRFVAGVKSTVSVVSRHLAWTQESGVSSLKRTFAYV
ncbi:MAG: NAD(P)-binding domain-containing protein [Dehalococcoidia bacterium]